MNRNASGIFLIFLKIFAWAVWSYFLIIESCNFLIIYAEDEVYDIMSLPEFFIKFFYLFSALFLIVELAIAFLLRYYIIIKPIERGKVNKQSVGGFFIIFIVCLVNWFIAHSISGLPMPYSLKGNTGYNSGFSICIFFSNRSAGASAVPEGVSRSGISGSLVFRDFQKLRSCSVVRFSGKAISRSAIEYSPASSGMGLSQSHHVSSESFHA